MHPRCNVNQHYRCSNVFNVHRHWTKCKVQCQMQCRKMLPLLVVPDSMDRTTRLFMYHLDHRYPRYYVNQRCHCSHEQNALSKYQSTLSWVIGIQGTMSINIVIVLMNKMYCQNTNQHCHGSYASKVQCQSTIIIVFSIRLLTISTFSVQLALAIPRFKLAEVKW